MAHRKIGSLRSKFGISRSMNDLTHIFSDKSKSDSEGAEETASTSNKYEKRSMRHKRLSGRFEKERKRNESTSSTALSSEIEDLMMVWLGVDIPRHDKDEHTKKGKYKHKEDKKLEKKSEKNKLTLSKSEGAVLTQKLSDQTDSLTDRKISSASSPPCDLTTYADLTSPSIPEEIAE